MWLQCCRLIGAGGDGERAKRRDTSLSSLIIPLQPSSLSCALLGLGSQSSMLASYQSLGLLLGLREKERGGGGIGGKREREEVELEREVWRGRERERKEERGR